MITLSMIKLSKFIFVFSVLQIDSSAHGPDQCVRGDVPVDQGGPDPGPGQGADQVEEGSAACRKRIPDRRMP